MFISQPTFTAAVVGLGFIGAADPVSGEAIGQNVATLDGTHAQALAGHPQVRLVAGSSRDEGRRRRFEQRLGAVKTYPDWREMLAVEKPDIVSVASNSPHHAEITIGCAEAGVKAVICEKPIATRLSDADRAIRACRESGTILVTNHNRRWSPYWRSLGDSIRSEAIGKPYHGTLFWPTGRLGNVGTHFFDTVAMLIGAKPTAVSGSLDPVIHRDCRGEAYRDPGGWGVVMFDNGMKLFVDAAQEAKVPLGLSIVGSLGQISARADRAQIELRSGEIRDIPAPVRPQKSLELAVQDVVNCLLEGSTPASTGEDGLAALEIIIGFHVSHRLKGQWVSLPIQGADRDLEVAIG